ncbi:MAG: biotin--[acetyl-CoA-carboxylase] ligase, partial [Bacteroidia bacterium]|nr:biotin--[acetyl-CoA-carboxylase] ligase [Bacteroidia bacterium]
PNDIYVDDRKIAGILIDNTLRGDQISCSIVGIGLNLNQICFRSDAPNPVSLKILTNEEHDCEKCLDLLCEKIENRYRQLIKNGIERINSDYLNRLYRINEEHEFKSGNTIFKGKITGVDNFGRLCIELKNRKNKVFGYDEVSFMIKNA